MPCSKIPESLQTIVLQLWQKKWSHMSMSITSTSELELSLISCASSDSTLTWQGVDKRKGRRPEGWGWGRFFKGGDYFKYFCLKGLIILGRRLIYGWLLFEECGTPSLSSRIDRLYCIKHAVSQPFLIILWLHKTVSSPFVSNFCSTFLQEVRVVASNRKICLETVAAHWSQTSNQTQGTVLLCLLIMNMEQG